MTKRWQTIGHMLAFAVMGLFAAPTFSQQQAPLIPDSSIASLQTQLIEADQSASSARKKLAIKRLIREAQQLVEQNADAANRFVVLGVLFESQKQLLSLEDSAENRAAMLEICRALAAAPDEYAATRLDADLLLTQAELARQGADARARADALGPLVERYRDTDVEKKVIRIAMLMALELGDSRQIENLREVIAQRFAGDLEMIQFQREKLAEQVFGAPFIGSFEDAKGNRVRFPMDFFGSTTAVFFWSKDNGGLEHVKELATAWNAKRDDARGRLALVSINLDNLPDAGESILREFGVDWPALRLPSGRDNPIYQTYAMRDPTIITVSPTGYAALFLSGGNSDTNGYERWLSSALAREWTQPQFTGQLQSLFIGEFFVLDPTGEFDVTTPPEIKASTSAAPGQQEKLTRTAADVPEDKLRAIQACFIASPARYRAPLDQVRAGYEQAEALCSQAIKDYPSAPNLWIVRNRRIVALMGLWKLDTDNRYLDRAATEAQALIDTSHPAGVDALARFCLARKAMHAVDADPVTIINSLGQWPAAEHAPGPALAAAALLALEAGDRRLHEQYRRDFIDTHVNDPMLWTVSAFLLDRYHRYWLYHPPFVAGWTYGRREGHFLAIGTPEDAQRKLELELKTVEGNTVRIPDDSQGKWTIINFVPSAQTAMHISRYGSFINDRPFKDVNLIGAVLNEDAQALKAALAAKTKPDEFPTLLVPDATRTGLVQKLGILDEDARPNLVILRPDGSIAAMLSGLTMSSQHGDVLQNVIEWHDELAVDALLAKGDLEEAKRLAFAFAPLPEPAAADRKPKAQKPIAIPHLRSRAKVYMAMENWPAALADAEEAYLQINSRAGWMSMRTQELNEIESLKADILSRMKPTQPAP